MMSVRDLVDGTHAFIKDCMGVSYAHMGSAKGIISRKLLMCLEEMLLSVNMTTDSAIYLIERSRVWDATILLRSVLDGSARICYLLSAKTDKEEAVRLHEFQDLLPRAEMGGIDKPLSGMINSNYYTGNAVMRDPILDPIKDIVEGLKPGPGEGQEMRELKGRWNFFRLSAVLKNECAMWSDFAPLFEYRYALPNQLVHKTDTGCGQVFERSLREPAYRDLSDLAHSESVLIALCLAMCSRLHTLSARVGANVHDFGPVLRKHQSLFEGGGKIEKAFAEEALKHVSRKE